MNIKKLKDMEAYFFETYPEGFEDAYFLPIFKRHNISKLTVMVQESFSKEKFAQPEQIMEDMIKIIS